MGNGAVKALRKGNVPTATDDDPKQSLCVEVAHYIHPMFVEASRLTEDETKKCQECYDIVLAGDTRKFRQAKEQSKEDEKLDPITFLCSDFYSSLYERIPSTKDLFLSEIEVQASILGRMMNTILSLVADTDKINTTCKHFLQDLARAHNSYNVHPAFYGEFAYTFICTLRKHLEEKFSEDNEEAWISLYSYILHIMVPVAVEGTRDMDLNNINPTLNLPGIVKRKSSDEAKQIGSESTNDEEKETQN
mmetsp:Transcript_15309/g.20203  ORF Transcript_15309/g.20203 Transcript_15309/m.20203 type:complete len:248 (+) Transcript_15309:95-838(+)